MVSNYNIRVSNLRIAIGTFIVLSLLLMSTSIAQIPLGSGSGSSGGGGGVEIRGEVAERGPFVWDAYNFQAFFYDLKGDGKTETLIVSTITGRTIPATLVDCLSRFSEVPSSPPSFDFR
jgi:hypothetical protein